ncbi:hypothetical protein [Burkholderia gladioli]|uniref:PD-(D/E)XK nuclease domain-containing protein n=1 Tax=Burkholderia gladioli TaxID=28095 RepID=UPI002FE022B3
MTDVWIGTALEQLRSNVNGANRKGNVGGLLAKHLLSGDPRFNIEWDVNCDEAWMRDVFDASNLACVAALAYTIRSTGDGTYLVHLENGLTRAAARDPEAAGHGTALHDIPVLVGLCIGAQLLRARSDRYAIWCLSVARQLAQTPRGRTDALTYYACRLCTDDPLAPTLDMQSSTDFRAAFDWWFRQPGEVSKAPHEQLTKVRDSVVQDALSSSLDRYPPHQSALLWSCIRNAISDTTSNALRSPATVIHALRNFETAMKRWRWDTDKLQNPVRWPIRSEREVQDILWLILRSIFDDLEDEDTLPKFGHSTYRADFGIPSLGLLIEAKYARSAGDFKNIEKEVLQDLGPYLQTPERYREVIVFIYDESSSVQHHDTTIRALRSANGITDVLVVCRPSQLPQKP